MEWHIAPRVRCDLVFFAGLNLSGERRVVEVHPVGGRQGDVRGEDIKSLVILGPIGTRVVFATDPTDDWESGSWRAVRLSSGRTYTTKDGMTGVRIPDLDWLDAYDARRNDPDLEAGFEQVTRLADGTEWTFGHSGTRMLKGNIRSIRIDKV